MDINCIQVMDFADHKGYPTAAHREALMRLGPCLYIEEVMHLLQP